MPEVDANVEACVIPVRLVVSAPLPVGVHPCDVLVHLMAVLTVSFDVVIDSRSVRFKPALAIGPPISIGASRTANSKYKSASKHACKNHSAPEFIAHRSHLHATKIPCSVLRFILSNRNPEHQANAVICLTCPGICSWHKTFLAWVHRDSALNDDKNPHTGNCSGHGVGTDKRRRNIIFSGYFAWY